MAILEKFDFKNINPLSVERFHLQAEISKIAYEKREENIGDPRFHTFDYQKLIESDYIQNLSSKILGVIDREWIALKLNELFVIEFYSRKI